MKKFVFDIDGTICEEGPSQERMFSLPKIDTINFINYLYEKGHFIILYTARSWDQFKLTEHWLKTYKVNYHSLLFGKPIYDYWIDDRCLNINDLEKIKNEF
jgi:hydroxymethylpyrimidine pyrophosphatase-like HAD family hydrolase